MTPCRPAASTPTALPLARRRLRRTARRSGAALLLTMAGVSAVLVSPPAQAATPRLPSVQQPGADGELSPSQALDDAARPSVIASSGTSQNGWPANSDPAAIQVSSFPVAGSSVSLKVRSGDVATVLLYVAGRVQRDVEALDPSQTFGYNYRPIAGSSTLSNHSSGTAIDLNSAKHPSGSRGTFTSAQVQVIRNILATTSPAVRWGGDYGTTVDEMHFEINVKPGDPALASVAAKLRGTGSLGVYEWQTGSGKVYQSTGAACSAAGCGGWTQLDDNPLTTSVVAGPDAVYQLQRSTGALYRSTGAGCTAAGCPGWTRIDSNPATTAVVAGAAGVFQFQAGTGQVFKWAGGTAWTLLDNNRLTTAIVAGADAVYELQGSTGALYRSTGAACTATGCPGWARIDANPATTSLVAGAAGVFQFQATTGQVFKWAGGTAWTLLDNNRLTTGVVAGADAVYELQGSTGALYRSTGAACTAAGCPGWTRIDTNLVGTCWFCRV